MGTVTHEQANLMLKLYEIRREPRLRQARAWFVENYFGTTPEEMMAKYPPGSEAGTNIRMVVSYWEMAAGLVNRGLIDDELFFENNGEAWLVWDRLSATVPPWRAAFKNPTMFLQLEKLATRFEAWRERVAPGSTSALRERMEQMRQAQAKAASQ